MSEAERLRPGLSHPAFSFVTVTLDPSRPWRALAAFLAIFTRGLMLAISLDRRVPPGPDALVWWSAFDFGETPLEARQRIPGFVESAETTRL